MPDRKNVIKGLQNLREAIATDFIHEADQAVGTIDDALALLKEQNGLMLALEQSNAVNGYLNAEVERLNGLLKEQEAVEPTFKQDEKGIFVWCCGSCGAYMYHIYDGIYKAKEYAKFCRQCGQAVKWDE